MANNEEDMMRQANEAEKRYDIDVAKFQKDAAAARDSSGEIVEDFAFKTTRGKRHLSEYFEGKADLIVIHNMGTCCSHCTMWADGLNGVQHHLRDRAGLVLVSPDSPETVEAFAKGREWKIPVASVEESGFTPALGFGSDEKPWPGMSTFHRDSEGTIRHIASECFGEYDLYSPVWHMVARLKDGANDWEPKFTYDESSPKS